MSISTRLRMVAADPPEILVSEEPGDCAYLQGESWCLPLRLPVRKLTGYEFGQRLEQGDRRQGRLLYSTACPTCHACESMRLDVNAFIPNRTQRRVLRTGNARFEVEMGPLIVTEERVRLYNLHKAQRDLARDESLATADAYQAFLGDSCCDTFEMRYTIGKKLVAIAIVDHALEALSAVYFYWDPAISKLSPGVFSILKQIELCQRLQLRHLYLGLYIRQCRAMAYKGAYLPHERFIGKRWERFERRPASDP